MTEPGTRLSLEAFLDLRAPDIADELARAAETLSDTTAYLLAALDGEAELATQVRRLGEAIPPDIAALDAPARQQIASEAEALTADIKSRWIAAETPPLVAEIDDRLAEISTAITTLRRPGPEALRATAAEIDRLARRTAHLDGIEHQYVPWAAGGAVLFILGLAVIVYPALLEGTPLASPWTILICLGALPGVGIHYARRVLPRSQSDTAIDELNRMHFAPLGGLYFPAAERPAAVIVIGPPPDRTEGDAARDERRRHRERVGPFW